MDTPKKKWPIRVYRSFEEMNDDEARLSAERTPLQRLKDTVQLISRVYGVPLDAKMKPLMKFGVHD